MFLQALLFLKLYFCIHIALFASFYIAYTYIVYLLLRIQISYSLRRMLLLFPILYICHIVVYSSVYITVIICNCASAFFVVDGMPLEMYGES